MSAYLLLCLAAFGCSMAFALVLGRWKEAFQAAGAQGPPPAAAPALVSLVVPARNAARTLTALLQDLHAQDWPKDQLEVLVVDDHSTDATAAAVRGMMRGWPALELLPAPGEGKKAAIAAAVARARGQWVVLTDADARCGPLRVRRIMDHVAGAEPDLLLMPVETRAGNSAVEWLQAEEQAALLGVAAGSALIGTPVLANGANMAFRKSAFLAVGGYGGDGWASGDDLFLLKRMRRAGRAVACLLAPEVLVRVDAEASWAAFLRQRLRWAGKMRAVAGAGAWGGACAIGLPWFLLCVSLAFGRAWWAPYDPVACLLLLAASWLLWLLPVLALAAAARRFLAAAGAPVRGRGASLSTALAVGAFQLYAPVVALLALVVRPNWKGRPT